MRMVLQFLRARRFGSCLALSFSNSGYLGDAIAACTTTIRVTTMAPQCFSRPLGIGARRSVALALFLSSD